MGWKVCASPSKQGPCRRCFSSLPSPNPTCLGAGQPAWAPTARKPRVCAPLGWPPGCCLRDWCMRSSGVDAELKVMVLLRLGSQNLKGSACSRQCCLVGKRTFPRMARRRMVRPQRPLAPLSSCGKLSRLLVWGELVTPLLLRTWQELWVLLTPGQRGDGLCFHRRGS